MKINDIIFVVLVNIISLLIILVCVFIWKKRQPMTARRLRNEIKRIVKTTDSNPFSDDFCKMRMMAAVLEDYIPYERTIAALLMSWTQKGFIALEMTPKKRLKSFGDDIQESIRFISYEPKGLNGAEQMLFQMLLNWTDETKILQKSELYQLSRSKYNLVFQRMEQFIIQGKHGLRATGQMQSEKKRRHFGFLEEQRPIFTQKGVRQAAQLKGYQQWLQSQNNISATLWRDAVLLDVVDNIDNKQLLSIAKTLSSTIITAANAGKQSKK